MGLDISYLVKSYYKECSPLEFVGQIIESIRAELAIDDNVYLVVKTSYLVHHGNWLDIFVRLSSSVLFEMVGKFF